MPKIKITINKVGAPKIEVEGAAGSSCQDMTKPFEEALLGANEAKDGVVREIKPEFYMSEGEQEHLFN